MDIMVVRLDGQVFQDQKEWIQEVVQMSACQDSHLCKLLGYALDIEKERTLVYEPLAKGTLDKLLYGRSDGPPLDWQKRMKIALDAAYGLTYLHENAPTKVDNDFHAKLMRYGFWRSKTGTNSDVLVCKHSFSFSPVYAENAPTRLPVSELLYGVFVKAGQWLHFFGGLMFVLSVWLLFIPFITFWIWRLTFVRIVAEAQKLFISRFTPGLLFTDCLNGFLLLAGIVFIFLGVTSLREYMKHVREPNGHDGDREGAAVDRQHGARAVHGNGAPGQRGAAAAANDPQGGVVMPAAVENIDAAGAGQLLRRNAENMAARLEMQAARLEAHVEQMFDAAEDVDGAEDVPFDELVGMQGPVLHLVENVITV